MVMLWEHTSVPRLALEEKNAQILDNIESAAANGLKMLSFFIVMHIKTKALIPC